MAGVRTLRDMMLALKGVMNEDYTLEPGELADSLAKFYSDPYVFLRIKENQLILIGLAQHLRDDPRISAIVNEIFKSPEFKHITSASPTPDAASVQSRPTDVTPAPIQTTTQITAKFTEKKQDEKKQVAGTERLRYVMLNLANQIILSLQTPVIQNLHTMSDVEFKQVLRHPTPGGTAEKIYRRDKSPRLQQELINLPNNPHAATRLAKPIRDTTKIYIIGHGHRGNPYIVGTGGKWHFDDFANYISQNLDPPAPPKQMQLRISVIACFGGEGAGSEPSFAKRLFDALQKRLAERNIENVTLEVVGRKTGVGRATVATDYHAQDDTMVAVTKDGEFTAEHGAFADLKKLKQDFEMADAEPFSEPVPKAEIKLPASAPAPTTDSGKAKTKESEIFSSDEIDLLDFDGTLTAATGQEAFNSPFFASLFINREREILKPIEEVKKILAKELPRPGNEKYRLREGVVNYLEQKVRSGKVCILSRNYGVYIKALLLAEGVKPDILDKIIIYDRPVFSPSYTKGHAAADILSKAPNVKHVTIADDDPNELNAIKTGITTHISTRPSPPKIDFYQELPIKAKVAYASTSSVSIPSVDKRSERKDEVLHKRRTYAEELIKEFFTLLNQTEEYKGQIGKLETESTGKVAGILMNINKSKTDYGPAFVYYIEKDAKVNEAIREFFKDIAKPERASFSSLPSVKHRYGYIIENENLEKVIDKLEIMLGKKSKPESVAQIIPSS